MKAICTLLALALCGVCIALGAEARSSAWREYSSAHFTLFSDRDPRRAEQLLRQFERFRFAALAITGRGSAQTEAPVSMYWFARKDDYRSVQPSLDVAGFYRDGWGGPEMVVGAEANLADVSLILFHEYVHFLMRCHSQIRYPSWYDEGFADLLAASQVADDHVLIGLVHPWRKGVIDDQANLLPLTTLLTTDAGGGMAEAPFYASSWLLMHFLQLGNLSGDEGMSNRLVGYMQNLANGADPLATFEAHFGLSVSVAQAKLQAYAQQGQWKGYKLMLPKQTHPVKSRTLHANETAYLLGGLAYRAGQPLAALEFLQRVDAGARSVAAAFSLRAVIEGHLGRGDIAEHILGFALAKNADSSVVLGNAAHLHWDLAKATQPNAAKRVVHLKKVAEYAEAALQADPSNIEAARFFAQLRKVQGRPDEAIGILLQQHQRRAGDVRLNLELGALYLQAGKDEQAASFLRNVMHWDHSSLRREEAAAMLKSMAQAQPDIIGDSLEENASPLRIAPNP